MKFNYIDKLLMLCTIFARQCSYQSPPASSSRFDGNISIWGRLNETGPRLRLLWPLFTLILRIYSEEHRVRGRQLWLQSGSDRHETEGEILSLAADGVLSVAVLAGLGLQH